MKNNQSNQNTPAETELNSSNYNSDDTNTCTFNSQPLNEAANKIESINDAENEEDDEESWEKLEIDDQDVDDLERVNTSNITDVSDLLCKICSKQFDNLHRLQRHMLSHDSNPDLRKFKCDFCDKAFKFKHHLKVTNNSCFFLLTFKSPHVYNLFKSR